ncbi:MAG: hypothetical protein ACM3SW_06295 [Actinomycetota bacterium]
MSTPETLDPGSLSFDEFVTFFFDHPESEQFWYADARYALADVVISGPAVVDHLTRLFSDFGAATSGYSAAQVSHGIWAISSPSFALAEALWDGNIPLENRATCIRSMLALFRDYVATQDADVLQKCFFMWWHIIVTGFWAQQRQFDEPDVSQLDPDSITLLNTIFETLTQILDVPDPRTQGYALHGLGHLHHPGVRGLVQHYIEQNKDRFTEEHVQWIEQCRDGVVS